MALIDFQSNRDCVTEARASKYEKGPTEKAQLASGEPRQLSQLIEQTRETDFAQIYLGAVEKRRRRDIRQQRAQLLQALSVRGADIRVGEKQAEILFQSAVDGVLQRKREHSWNGRCRHARREWARPERSGYGLAWARSGVSFCARDVAIP